MEKIKAFMKKDKVKKIARRAALIIMIRIQMFCLSAGVLWWIIGFDLADKHPIFIGLGMVCVPIIILSLVPIPTERELEDDWEDKI